MCSWKGICWFSADWMEGGLLGGLLSFLPGGLLHLGSNISFVGVHAGSVCSVLCCTIMYLLPIHSLSILFYILLFKI